LKKWFVHHFFTFFVCDGARSSVFCGFLFQFDLSSDERENEAETAIALRLFGREISSFSRTDLKFCA